MQKKLFLLLCFLPLGGPGIAPVAAQRPAPTPGSEDLPSEFIQLLPRGRISSVDSPEFLTAEEAEIPDDAWVMGVVIEGQARAYSLNLLNRHEVINDEIEGVKFAAVW